MDKKQIGWRPSEFRSVEEVGYEADETEKKNREVLQSEITCNFTFVLDCEHDEREVERNGKNADFRKYWDIEKYNAVVLSIRDSIEFEKENKIIYPKTCLKTDMYYKIQKEFINYACKYGQERAVKHILKKWR